MEIDKDKTKRIIEKYAQAWHEEENIKTGELWKWKFKQHVKDNFVNEYNISEIPEEKIENIVQEVFGNTRFLDPNVPVPVYLAGGQTGGMIWQHIVEKAKENQKECSKVFSILFDNDKPIDTRLNKFKEFFGGILDRNDVSGGPFLTVSTALLMFVFDNEFIAYKIQKMVNFITDISDLSVNSKAGFDVQQYKDINNLFRNILPYLDDYQFDDNMLHLHNMLWQYKKNAHGLGFTNSQKKNMTSF